MQSEPTGPGRTEARERAISLLYEAEMRAMAVDDLLDSLPLEPDRYAVTALHGVESHQVAIDAIVSEHAEDWKLDRMPPVDRAILRLAVWELTERADVPIAVVINEAIELAKEYSTERSPAFINGVLDSVATAVRD